MPPGPGCQHCTDTDAAVAWARARGLATDREIVAESHVRVALRSCPSCGQGYAWIFGETTAWADGNDPQEWLLVPVTTGEARLLTDAAQPPRIAAVLGDLSPRRYVQRRFGHQDDAPHADWATGLVIFPPHD